MTRTTNAPPSLVSAFALLMALPALAAGCTGEAGAPQAVDTGTGSGAATVAEPHSDAPEVVAVEYPEADALEGRIRAELGAELNTALVSGAAGRAVEALLGGNRDIGLSNWRREVFTELYSETDWTPVYIGSDGGLSPIALAYLDELRGAYQHALDADDYQLSALEEGAAALAEAGAAGAEWTFDEHEMEALVDRAIDMASAYPDEWLTRLALEAVGRGGDWRIDSLRETFDERSRGAASTQRARAQLELRFADSFLSWARDMNLANVGRMSATELRAAGGSNQVVADRLREAHRQVREMTPEAFTAYLDSLIPHHSQYHLLMESYARYSAIVEAGGWPEVRPRSLRRGSNNPRVRQLKERLAIEGFFTGTIDDNFDEDLEAAVTSYQESHQMEVSGRTHDMFWDSVNVPAEHRLRQIAVTLGRWRESRIGDDTYYIWVNIPDFHGEVWRDGERLRRFRVVTGNTARECDPATHTMRMVNATPLLSGEMEYLVLNPYWNVPIRIRRDELDEEINDDPQWLQEHGYEVVVTGGTPRIRQLPGPNNALGQVKFIFPNDENIYLHDTPRQRYFEYPIRAYSHGCVRVHEPLALAELLLREDGAWDEERFQRILDSDTETTWRFDTHIPVHIEYYVVTVDEQGRTNFLADVYRYDRERMGLPPDRPQRCGESDLAEAQEESPLTWNPDGSAVTADGTVIHADGRVERSAVPVLDGTRVPDPEDGADFGP